MVPSREVNQLKFQKKEGILGLMDGTGSNLEKINNDIPGIVSIIGTSNPGSKAGEKAKKWNVPLVELDFGKYESEHGVEKGDFLKALNPEKHSEIKSSLPPEDIIKVREEVCHHFLEMLYETMDKENIPRDIPVFAAGFMAILSDEFVNSFFILNVHPGDLTQIKNGKRFLTGGAWIPSAKALKAGHKTLYSSVHHMTPELDSGPLFMRGYGLPIDYSRMNANLKDHDELRKVAEAAQEALKHLGDHVIAGATFMDLFKGNWGFHKKGLAYRMQGQWQLVPKGILIEDHVKNNPGSVFHRDEKFIREKIEEFYKQAN